MDNKSGFAIIELGSCLIKCIVVNLDEDGKFKIIGNISVESIGIHNGVIINLNEASKSIGKCLEKVEKNFSILISKAYVLIDPSELKCSRLSKYRKIGGSKIQLDDISYLLKDAKKQIEQNDKEESILHIFNYNYWVDGKKFDSEPIDIFANSLKHCVTFLTCPRNIIKNIGQAFLDCDIEIIKFLSSSFAQAVECLSEEDLKFGSILLDFGSEKTSIIAFKNMAPYHLKNIPIGINHITKDIAKSCSITISESTKIRNDFTLMDEIKLDDEFLEDFYFTTTRFRKISKKLISKIIIARFEEILDFAKKEINFSQLKMDSGNKIIITGGGSNLKNIEEYLSKYLNLNVLKCNNNYDDKKNALNTGPNENYLSCLGALKLISSGFETEAIAENKPKKVGKFEFFSKLFGKKNTSSNSIF